MNEKEKTVVVIIDDNLKTDDPLIVELNLIFSDVKLFEHSEDGLNYVKNNLIKRMVVVLDINFSPSEINGHEVLELIRKDSKLIPVIIWSAKDFSTGEDFTDFINNQAMFYVKQTSSTEEILGKIKEANRLLKLDVATAIEEWLEEQENKDQILLLHGNGEQYSANDLINEIRKQTLVGQEIEENMLKLTIDLLFRASVFPSRVMPRY